MKRSEIRDCFTVCKKPGLRCASSGLRLLVHIEIGGSMPMNEAVNNWWEKNTIEGRYSRKVIEITKGEEHKLGDLAKLIAAIVKKPYNVKAYKYVCPEVASVLRKTEKVLEKVWAI
jgi:hypothetical protein